MRDLIEQIEAQQLYRAGRRLLRKMEYAYHKQAVRDLLWQAQDGKCLCCGRDLVSHRKYPKDGARDTLDHVMPKHAGGVDALGNLALLRHKCNAEKGHSWPSLTLRQRLKAINARLGWPDREPHIYP